MKERGALCRDIQREKPGRNDDTGTHEAYDRGADCIGNSEVFTEDACRCAHAASHTYRAVTQKQNESARSAYPRDRSNPIEIERLRDRTCPAYELVAREGKIARIALQDRVDER